MTITTTTTQLRELCHKLLIQQLALWETMDDLETMLGCDMDELIDDIQVIAASVDDNGQPSRADVTALIRRVLVRMNTMPIRSA